MNPLHKEIALKVHRQRFIYDKSIINHRCVADRQLVILAIKNQILAKPAFEHLAAAWANDDLVIARKWRYMRDTYCSIQLDLINEHLAEGNLTQRQRDFLEHLDYLHLHIQHIQGQANVSIQLDNELRDRAFEEALEDWLGDNRYLLHEMLAQIRARRNAHGLSRVVRRQGNRRNRRVAPRNRGAVR